MTQALQARGWVSLPGLCTQWVDDMSVWANELTPQETPSGDVSTHWELTVGGARKVCRAERFVGRHEGLSALEREVRGVAEEHVGEPLSLMKEKINYKSPGGGGFAAHVDTPAYLGYAPSHVTVMVAIDAADQDNGALELASGDWSARPGGLLSVEEEANTEFEMLNCEPGDVVLFGGWTPHRSASNSSRKRWRRALFLTYNLARHGDHRDVYYEAKENGTDDFSSATAISFQPDFKGIVVA
jgi:ectoine hydroxylase-related dioxygenase (phytanoyl-CoA dioxygenase family)